MAQTGTAQGIPLLGPLLSAIFGTRNERFVKRYTQRVDAINALEPSIRSLSDEEIRAKTAEFRERLASGERDVDLMNETFAVAREAMDRAVGIRNIFNPAHRDRFPKDRLPDDLRAKYEALCAEMDALEPAAPDGPYLGCAEAVPGWRQLDIPTELYGAVRELFPESRPPFRSRPFDVQLIGAMVIYQGKIAEMRTGEGKTIVAPLAAYLASLTGKRVHVVTVNDYLVQRDRDWTFPYFLALGLRVGAIHPMHMQPEDEKRRMYRCEVVYGTTAEFGFDYLRDNMKRTIGEQVQRTRDFAIVDEVDSTLIDEARTPLIISGQAHNDKPRYDLADRLARHLVERQKPWAEADAVVERCKMRIKGLEGDIRNARDKGAIPGMQEQMRKAKAELPGLEGERDRFTQYYEVELDRKQAHLTHNGVAEAQRVADIGSFYVGENMDVPHLLENALRAHVVYQRDRDYVIMPVRDPRTGREEPGVVIVDVNTGRPMVGRQWSDGLHQAVETKEGVQIKEETQTVATVTIQNFFKMYKRLAGMTGTADTEAQEFHDIYKLDVVSIPTNLPVVRNDFDDLVFLTAKDKWDTIVDEIKAFHDVGRPVLVGTTSVEKSEKLSEMLRRKHGIEHEVLNAKQHEREAHIVENAGQLGAVMIATNMAGRGTDIKLGRISREQLLNHWLRRGIAPRELTVEDSDERVRELIFRKIAPKELGITKQEAQEKGFEELELALLRHWAARQTLMSEGRIDSASAEALRAELDARGRSALHRVGWVESVEELGGLHVIGTERHESRRIDNQLRGRSGRQGDRGSSRFFVSLEDDLMKMFAGEATMKILSRLGMKEGDAIESGMLTKAVERAQRKVEERNFQIRKQILEYDEVMEHQRQSFYGLRQRVLEGDDVRAIIFEFFEQTIGEKVGEHLDPMYPAECAAEFARQALDYPVAPERLKGREPDEMVDRIRADAKSEARQQISITLGEYMPEGAEDVDLDLKGLASWASKHFKVDLKPSELRSMEMREVERALIEAAEAQIDSVDLSGVERFADPEYGAQELCRWVSNALGLEVKVEEIFGSPEAQAGAAELIIQKAEDAYRRKEIEYPVEFSMRMTESMMASGPDRALAGLAAMASRRYGLDWTPEKLRTKLPQQIQDELRRASREFVESGRVDRAIEAALASGSEQELAAHLRDEYGVELPDEAKGLDDRERARAARRIINSLLRPEMARFEHFVLIEVLDPGWKDHLYAMDQLRDSIGFRAFSQQDPRIEYKREGSRLFSDFNGRMRERVTEYAFKLTLLPQGAPPPARRAQQSRPAAAPMGGSIVGPGLDAAMRSASPADQAGAASTTRRPES